MERNTQNMPCAEKKQQEPVIFLMKESAISDEVLK
jgi:hypothetical protein